MPRESSLTDPTRIRVIAALLLQNRGLVKTVRFEKPKYIGDPINAVKIFNEKECDELMILDIEASKKRKSPQFELIEDIAKEAFMPFGYGGGIRSLEHIQRILSLGAEKVVLNTICFERPGLITEASNLYGSQAIVASIDVKKTLFGKYEVHSHSRITPPQKDPASWAQELERLGAGEIVLNSVDQDGTQQGYDIQIIRKVSDAVSIPVIAAGGAGSIGDFKKSVQEGHASAVSAGSLFVFHGRHRAVLISYPSSAEIDSISNP